MKNWIVRKINSKCSKILDENSKCEIKKKLENDELNLLNNKWNFTSNLNEKTNSN